MADITLKHEGCDLVSLTNTGGNKVFYFMNSLKIGGRISAGPYATKKVVMVNQVGLLREMAEEAGLTVGY